jgi:flagellar biosynthesis/type III secretory pathway protein FliH
MSSSDAPADAARAAAAPLPWLPAAWPDDVFAPDGPGAGAPGAAFVEAFGTTSGATPADGAFVAGLFAGAPAAAAGPALAAFLPEFGGARRAPGAPARLGGGDSAVEAACDAREAAVRAEYEARQAAERAVDAERRAAELDAAYAEGAAAGRAEGEAAAHAALAETAGALAAALDEVRTHESRWLADLEAHVAALAVAVARHVVEREVARDDALVTTLVARAVAEFPADQALTVRAHPADLPALRAAWAGAAGAARSAELRWLPDAGVVRGGALVEGRERIVDGRVDAALERVYRAVGGHQA